MKPRGEDEERVRIARLPPPPVFSCFIVGKESWGEGGRAAESEWRFGGREQGAESEGKLALGWTTQAAALHEKREKMPEILQKIEIILIRSDSACQWSMQTISVVTKRCGRYWACSVSRAAPTSTGCLAKGTEGHVAAASAPSARSGLPRFCTRSSPGGGVRAAPRLPGSELLFFFLRCLFENTAEQFCCVLAAVQVDALKKAHWEFKAIGRCQNPTTAAWAIQLQRMKARKKTRLAEKTKLTCRSRSNARLTFLL